MFLSPARYASAESPVPPARGLRAPGAVAGPRGHCRGAEDPHREGDTPRSGRGTAQRGGGGEGGTALYQ